jgi:hypothetical protein
MAAITTLRALVRRMVRAAMGLPTVDPTVDWRERRRRRLQRDADAWAKQQAAEARRRADDELIESEILRAELERRGGRWPGDDC